MDSCNVKNGEITLLPIAAASNTADPAHGSAFAPLCEVLGQYGFSSPAQIGRPCRALRLRRCAVLGEKISDRPTIAPFDALQQFVMHRLRGSATEDLIFILLDRKSCLIRSGSIVHVEIYQFEVVRLALLYGTSAVIVVHNHLSDDPTPSTQDVEITQSVANALSCLDIALHEHLIVGRRRMLGLQVSGLLRD